MKREEIVSCVKAVAIPASTAVMMAVPTICAFAAEGDPASGVAGVDINAITTGAFSDLSSTMGVIIAAATGAAISLIGVTVGVKYLLKKIRGIVSQVA